MFDINKYLGDGEVKKALDQFRPSLSFASFRAATAGAVLAVEMVKPSALYAHLFGDEDDRPSFKDADAAKAWCSCMMALWNEVTKYQSEDEPFVFSEWPSQFAGSNEELLQRARDREDEIEHFLWGLRAGNTPFADDFENPESEDLLSWKPAFFEAGLRLMNRTRDDLEKGKSKEWIVLSSLHFALNDQMRELHADFVSGSKEMRSEWLEEMSQSETVMREEPKIGRNDRCPGGSGKKFKRCCLQ